jgi:hypothetical protein
MTVHSNSLFLGLSQLSLALQRPKWLYLLGDCRLLISHYPPCYSPLDDLEPKTLPKLLLGSQKQTAHHDEICHRLNVQSTNSVCQRRANRLKGPEDAHGQGQGTDVVVVCADDPIDKHVVRFIHETRDIVISHTTF